MDETYSGADLASLGIEEARTKLVGKKVTLSIDSSPHTATYQVAGVELPTYNPDLALIIKPVGHSFTLSVGKEMSVTIIEK